VSVIFVYAQSTCTLHYHENILLQLVRYTWRIPKFFFLLLSAGISLTSCLASGIVSILSTWLLTLTLIFSILFWCGCYKDSYAKSNWRKGIVGLVLPVAVGFSLCVIANSVVAFTGIDSCGANRYATYVQVAVSYILIVAFAAFFLLLIRTLRAEEDG